MTDYEDIDLEYLQHFWGLSSDEMIPIIQKAKELKRPKFYITLLMDLKDKKKLQEEEKTNDG